MTLKQINLKLPENLFEAAERYVNSFGYKNIQALASESIREKIFERTEYDEDFSNAELELIDGIISSSIKKKKLVSEEELNKALLK
jgi:hypothetical protein